MSNSSGYDGPGTDAETGSCVVQSIVMALLLGVSEVMPSLPIEYNGILHTLIAVAKKHMHNDGRAPPQHHQSGDAST